MSRRFFGFWLGLALAFPLRSVAAETTALPYLVALDFESSFDQGRLGQQVGRMFRFKSTRRGLFSVDAEIDWADRGQLMPRPELDAKAGKVSKAAKEKFGCDIIVWGAIERPRPQAPPTVIDRKTHVVTKPDAVTAKLRLHVRAIDLRKDPPRLALAATYDCKNQYELRYKVDEVLKLLSGVSSPADVAQADPANRMKAFGPNLCPLGDLEVEYAQPPQTEFNWRAHFKGWHFPMTEGIQQVTEIVVADGQEIRNRAFKYTLSAEVAGLTGLFCYSPYIPIKPRTYYQVSFRVKSEGPKVIMFVKGYRDLEVKGYAGKKTHRQEVFKHQKRFYGETGKWGTLTSRPFLPRSAKPEHRPQFLRVQLYAYHPAGVVCFDDVVVRECREVEASPPTPPKETPGGRPDPLGSSLKPGVKPELRPESKTELR